MEGCLNILCVFSCWGGKFRGCCRFLSKSNRCGVFTYDLNIKWPVSCKILTEYGMYSIKNDAIKLK